MQYQCKRLSVTPAKHTPKQYHSNTQYIAQYIDTQNNTMQAQNLSARL